MLQGVLDGARALTDSRYGVMALPGDARKLEGFLSSGLTAEQARGIWKLP